MRSRTFVVTIALTVLTGILAYSALSARLERAFNDMAEAERDGPGRNVEEHENDVPLGTEHAASDEVVEALEQHEFSKQAALVSFGIYFSDISHISFVEGTFHINAYVWMNWDPTRFLPPGASAEDERKGLPRAPCDTFGFVDAFELTIEPVVKDPGYAQFRVIGSIRQEFKLDRFPLDRHVLRVSIEDEEHADHILRFEPDVRNSGTNDFRITGWKHERPIASTYTRLYDTNFGDRSLPTGDESFFSGITFEIPIRQVRLAYFVKLTCGLFISTLLALISLVVAHYGVDRLGFPVGALFAVVASQWVVGEALPPRAPPTIADWLHVISFGVILAVMLVNVRSLLVLEAGDPDRSKAIDRRWFWIIGPSWLGVCILVCVLA
jgi:hypothetical protein